MTVSTPFLSPYLRTVLTDGVVRFDNALTQALEKLSPVEESVVRALWDPPLAELKLRGVMLDKGEGAVMHALRRLRQKGYVFDDLNACNAALDRSLDAALSEVPFLDQVELTNVCPMRCGFCPRGRPDGMSRPKGFMKLDLFTKLLDQVHPQQGRYRLVELHHLGESLMHPQVVDFFRAASARQVPVEISVNPSLLTPRLGRDLIESGVRRLVLSLDGMDDETLTHLRGPRALYSQAEPNIEALLAQAARRPDPPRIVIQMLALDRNRHQREAFLERWKSTGFPFVEAYVKALEGPDPDTGKASSNPASYLCTYPWRSVVVLWDGRVVPCCRDHDAAYALGNLNEQSLREIWQGERASLLRAAHRADAFIPGHLCYGCTWRRSHFARTSVRRHPELAQENPLQW